MHHEDTKNTKKKIQWFPWCPLHPSCLGGESMVEEDVMRGKLTGLWAHGEFVKLWAGQTVSQFGSQVTLLALPLTAALTLHATPAAMGFLAASETAPFLLVGLLAGVWVDRMPRRPILMLADCGRFALLLLIPVFALLGVLHIWLLCLIAFLVGILTVFFDVAYQSYLPALVGRAQLVEGNGKLEVSRSVAQIAGPSIAGVLVQLITAPFAMLVDALSFLASVLFLRTIRTVEPAPAPRDRSPNIWREINVGVRVILDSPLLRPIAACTATGNLFNNMAQAVFVLFVTRSLGIGPGLLGLIYGVGSVGALIGALFAGRVARRLGLGRTIVAASLADSIGWLLVPFLHGPVALTVPLLMAVWFGASMGSTVYNINQVSLRQAITPDHLLGRMNATMRFIIWGALPIGALAGGVLGAAFGLRAALAIGVCGQSLAFLWPFFSPVRTLRAVPAQTADVGAETTARGM